MGEDDDGQDFFQWMVVLVLDSDSMATDFNIRKYLTKYVGLVNSNN